MPIKQGGFEGPSEGANERLRLDQLLVRNGLAETREQAQRLILAGEVEVEGHSQPKPGQRVTLETVVRVRTPLKYVSRGGHKLEAALDAFAIDPAGLVCLDVGASTGGFTDCLLQRGAARVFAVDVGRGQLHQRLRTDPRVVVLEGINARELSPDLIPQQAALVVMDLAFISAAKVLPAVAHTVPPPARAIVLVKPQFEATRREASKFRGVVVDPAIHLRILTHLIDTLPATGWHPTGLIPSPIRGASGNCEYLLALDRRAPASAPLPAPAIPAVEVAAAITRALESAFP